jgi:hypothetical protein
MPLSSQVTAEGIISTLVPNKLADSQSSSNPMRLNGNRELVVRESAPGFNGLCEEGSLLLCTNPTISTGMTWVAAQTAYSDTVGNFYIQNNEAAGGKSLQMRYLKLLATTAGTAATVWHYAAILDMAARYPTTANIASITPVNPNGGSSNAAAPTVLVQNSATPSVYPASSAAKRIVTRGALGGLNIVGDVFLVSFGQLFGQTGPLTAAEGATQSGSRVASSPPVTIPPGGSLLISFWSPSSSAAFTPEFELLMSAK